MEYIVLCLSSLLAIVDPIGLVPAFLAVTHGRSPADRIRISALACAITFAVLALFAFFGSLVLRLFSVTLHAFEIAGGLLLFFVAMDMLYARLTGVRQTPEEQDAGVDKDDVAVTPLAIPMLAGPGAITTVMILASRASGWTESAALLFCIFAVSLAAFFVFYMVSLRAQLINVFIQKIFTRLMGLLLAAIAVQFILNGLAGAGFLRLS